MGWEGLWMVATMGGPLDGLFDLQNTLAIPSFPHRIKRV